MTRRYSRRLVVLLLSSLLSAGAQVIGTFAGTEVLFPAEPLPALSAPLGHVQDVAIDSTGAFLVTDRDNHVVIRVSNGILQTFAGNGLSGYSGDGDEARNASLRGPQGLAIDRSGNVYISDFFDHRVRRVALDGTISTVAGTGSPGFNGDGPAASRQLFNPRGLAMDRDGNLYIADSGNHRVRKLTTSGELTTMAGTGEAGSSGNGGPANAARLSSPGALAIDAAGAIYIGMNGAIRRVDPSGVITMFAGLTAPAGLAFDPAGRLVATEGLAHIVVRYSPDGSSPVQLAGLAGGIPGRVGSFSGDGGPAVSAGLNSPGGVAVSSAGSIFFADRENLRVRGITPDGVIVTVAGNGLYRFAGDGEAASTAALRGPSGIRFAPDGSALIADSGNNRIRGIARDGTISTFAGNGLFRFAGDGGFATEASLAAPADVFTDVTGTYIADRANNAIRKVDPSNIISTFERGLQFPYAISRDSAGNTYVADTNNDRIQKILPDKTVITVAGGGGSMAEGVPATAAALSAPQGVAIDAQNRLYISDTNNDRIRVVENGAIRTIAGGGSSNAENVPATSARLNSPRNLVIDAAGSLYFSDNFSNRVRRIRGGTISTIAGVNGSGGFAGDGDLAVRAALDGPLGLAFDASGNLHIADSNNNRIRKVFSEPPRVSAAPASLLFAEPSLGLRSAPRLITVFSPEISGLAFSVGAVNRSPWLRISPQAGTTPAALEVSADPGLLSPGTYADTLRITVPLGNPPVIDVAVSFTVTVPSGPLQSIQPESLTFAFVVGSLPRQQILTIANRGGGTLPFSIIAATGISPSWLSVSPRSGEATAASPAFVGVTADPAGMRAGTYQGSLSVTLPTGIVVVPVRLTITTVQQTLTLSQSGMTFTGLSTGRQTAPQTFRVLNTGQGVMEWSASVIAQPGVPIFATLAPLQGSSDAASTRIPAVSVKVDPTGLKPGQYFNQIRVVSPTAVNSPQFIPLVLEVLPPDQDPGPSIVPAELVFATVAGAPSPGSQDLQFYTLEGDTTTYRSQAITDQGPSWLTYLPTEASVSPTQPRRVAVQPDAARLTPNVYRGTITFRFDRNQTRKVNITTLVLPSPSSDRAKDLRSAEAACSPSSLVIGLEVFGSDFVVPAGLPMALIASVRDNCNRQLSDGRVHVLFDNGDPPQSMLSSKDGRWSSTWIPSRIQKSVKLTIDATTADGKINNTMSFSGTTRSSDVTPAIAAGGVVSAANFVRKAVSPGALVAIFGTDLATATQAAPSVPLGTQLSETRALLGGREMPLTFVGPNQVNAIVPFELNPNTTYQLVVSNGSRLSNIEPVVIAPANPEVFNTSLGPAITDERGSLITADNPARPGQVLVIYAAGLGATEATPRPGGAGASPTSNPVSVMVDDRACDILYAGLSPAFPGVYQINVRLPLGLGGGATPLSVLVVGQRSSEVALQVGR